MSSYYDDPDFAEEYARRDEEAIAFALEDREWEEHQKLLDALADQRRTSDLIN